MRNLIILLIIGVLLSSCNKDDENELPEGIQYTVTFTMNWNSTDFPLDYPSNDHFSPLIGWSHNVNSTFFQLGTMASAGIKNMAETGNTSPLSEEIDSKISNGEGYFNILGSGLDSGTGEISVDIVVNESNPAVTLSTMVAPSPDWYVAVVNVNLLEDGSFVNEKVIDAHVYDAGTDDGVTYLSENMPTNPPAPISLFVDSPMGNGTELNAVIATVKFKKK